MSLLKDIDDNRNHRRNFKIAVSRTEAQLELAGFEPKSLRTTQETSVNHYLPEADQSIIASKSSAARNLAAGRLESKRSGQ